MPTAVSRSPYQFFLDIVRLPEFLESDGDLGSVEAMAHVQDDGVACGGNGHGDD